MVYIDFVVNNLLVCLFPSNFNSTNALVCGYNTGLELSHRDRFLFDCRRTEKFFLATCITCFLIIISLSETLFYVTIFCFNNESISTFKFGWSNAISKLYFYYCNTFLFAYIKIISVVDCLDNSLFSVVCGWHISVLCYLFTSIYTV